MITRTNQREGSNRQGSDVLWSFLCFLGIFNFGPWIMANEWKPDTYRRKVGECRGRQEQRLVDSLAGTKYRALYCLIRGSVGTMEIL